MTHTPTTESSPSFLGRTVLIAIAALVVINVGAFLVFYRDTLGSVSLPYREDFSATTRLDYRQFGGTWDIVDGALAQRNAELPDQFAVLRAFLPAGAPGSFSATMRFTSPKSGGGLLFGMDQPDDRAGSQLVRFGRGDDGAAYLVYGAFDADLAFTAQGTVPLDALGESARLAVRFGPDTYDILLDDAPVATNVPLTFRGGHVALTTWFSSVVFDDVTLEQTGEPGTAPAQPVATAAPAPVASQAPVVTEAPAAPTVPPVATPAPQALAPDTASLGHIAGLDEPFDSDATAADWLVMMGDWVRKDGALVQQDATRYDLAIVHRATVSGATIRVHLTHREGLGAGVLFALPRVDSLRGGHLVRFGTDGTLFWGAFDENATFTGQGYAATDVAVGETHLLEVRLGTDTYAIALDGTILARGVPLTSPEGHVGLTSSVTVAAFEDLTITGGAGGPDPAQAAVVLDPGAWTTDAGVVTQASTQPGFSALSADVYSKSFDASVRVALPTGDTTASAGLVFNARSREARASAQAVRIEPGDRRVTWGVIDADGVYAPIDGVDLPAGTGSSPLLGLHVAGTRYDVLIGGATVATDLPIDAAGGWIGLATWGGPVTFPELQIRVLKLAA